MLGSGFGTVDVNLFEVATEHHLSLATSASTTTREFYTATGLVMSW